MATAFEYRAHPIDTVLGGMVLHPLDRAADAWSFYRQFTAEASDELPAVFRPCTRPRRVRYQDGRNAAVPSWPRSRGKPMQKSVRYAASARLQSTSLSACRIR